MGIAEDYIEELKSYSGEYSWPIDSYNKNQVYRMEAHKDFPYVVTLEGIYEYHDDIESWCRKEHGSRHGECQWRECEFSYAKWHEETYEEELETQLAILRCDRKTTNWRKQKKNKRKRQKVIHDHFEMIETHPDKPEDHSHKGIWTTVWLMKTGYDYGYQDYCFKDETDAIMFAFKWKGET